MVIFHSYFSLPDGIFEDNHDVRYLKSSQFTIIDLKNRHRICWPGTVRFFFNMVCLTLAWAHFGSGNDYALPWMVFWPKGVRL